MKNEYFPYFVGIFAGVNECSFLKFVSFMVGFGDSLAQGSEELWRSRNLCLSGADFLHFSGPKCRRIMAFLKFVHPETLEFCVVGELSCRGLLTGNRMLNFVSFCYWKGAKFVGKNIHILGNFDVRRPRFV